jgi:hypothetical protein
MSAHRCDERAEHEALLRQVVAQKQAAVRWLSVWDIALSCD